LYQPLDRRQLYQMLDTANRPMAETSLPQWHGFRVLAVDDHPPNLLVLEALLAELGIAVVSVNSGFDAIDYMQQQFHESDKAVDLIFMDIQMPRMSGSEAATRIRQLEAEQVQADGSIKHLPIVALTAHSLSDERDKLLASGIDDYVGKPISQVQLLQILQRWLGKNSTAKANLLVSAALTDTDTPLAVLPVNETTRATQTPTTSPQPSSIPTAASTVPALTYSGATESLRSSDSDTEKDPEFFQLSVIDWEDALMRVAGKTDLASNLLIMMIDSVPKERNDLQQAWQKHDRQELANVAHRILGASRYTGVPQLRYASQKLEDKSLLNVSNVSPAQFAMLTPYYEQLLQALDNVQNADLSAHTQLKYARLTEDNMNWKMF
jgi:two-component system sensor histidine kinase BarA